MPKPNQNTEEQEELEIEEELEEQEEEQEEQEEEAEDRGDNAEPELNERNLSAVAGEEEEEQEEEEGEQQNRPGFIPKGRFDEVNNKLKSEQEARVRLEERLRLLEERGGSKKQDEPAEEQQVDVKALRRQRNQAMLDGDLDKVDALDEQIDAIVLQKALEQARAEDTATTVQRAFAEAVADVIEQYPYLDSRSDAANADAIDYVVAMRNSYMAKGDSAADALRKAADKAGKLFAPAAAEEEESDDQRQKQVSMRERLALKRNAETARRQPPPMNGGQGNRATGAKLDPKSLSDEEFGKLPAKVKREMRGDTL
ncbi:hypothetical protein [Solimonas marina]|uniref:Scaffolding protein n=1 Tax=Solimonas marina TaxID=2714601 RepID=A0A969W6J5_9GAMM|nr:hypothetical protein [Solimonas marina]NKF21581.1 hypothetical protein [Solimonas marina]